MQTIAPQPEYRPADAATDSYRLRWSDYLLLVLAGLGLLGATLLGNPQASSRAWPAGSVLERIVWILSLGYSLPTSRGLEIKSLLTALISGLLLIGATIRLIRRRVRLLDDWQGFHGSTTQRANAATLSVWAALLLIVWGWLSASWAGDVAIAFGSVWVFSLGWVWAAGLALHGHRSIVRPLADVLLGVAAVTAVLSLWYWKVRSQDARLGWPMGNPLLLASVMLPPVLIGAGRLAEHIEELWRQGWQGRRVAATAACALAVGLALATLLATGSRGPVLALVAGLAAAAWISLPRTARVAWALVAVVVLAMAAPTVADKVFSAGGGRDASARLRLYAWHDAMDLALQKPSAGQGAGGFARLATSMAARDTVTDPLAMGGQVSTHAHCEMLELLADLGIFGLFLGLAIWAFAGTAAAAKARGRDRWIAACITGAVVAVFLDACSGVSWRMPGPAAFMAMPAALAWMLWREPRHTDSPGRGFTWPGLIPAVVGAAVIAAGVTDFAAARALHLADLATRQAEIARQHSPQLPPAEQLDALQQEEQLAIYAIQQADWAKLYRLDPPRRLEAWLASGRLREALAYLPVSAGKGDPPSLARGQQLLDDGLAILTAMNNIAPDYGDLRWRMAELLDGKAGLAQRAGLAGSVQEWRGQSLSMALQHFEASPLDADRIWRAMAVWPEIPPAQRLQLLRGTLRAESQVWREPPTFNTTAYQRWSEQHWYLNRLWHALGAQAADVANQSLELAYSQLQVPYDQWQNLLAPEGVRIAAWYEVLAGKPADAANTLALADVLYEHSNGLLIYSRAANQLDLAACCIRQGKDNSASADAALVAARRDLRQLPDNWVRRQIEQAADVLQQAIDVVSRRYGGDDPAAWQAAVDLFWDMPPKTWPGEIAGWAKQADDLLARQQAVPPVQLQLAIARGDLAGAQARAEQLLRSGINPQEIDAAVRQAKYRWPWRQQAGNG